MLDPFNVPGQYIGTPYHGLCANNVLTLPDSSTHAVVTEANGPSYKLVNPFAPGNTRTATQQSDDLAAGREWRDYALRSHSGHVNGMTVSSHLYVIYIDPAGTPWHIKFEESHPGGDLEILGVTVQNKGRFGFISYNPRTVNSPSLKYQEFSPFYPPTITPGDPIPDYYNLYPESVSLTSLSRLSQNQDGTVAIFNVVVKDSSSLSGEIYLNQVVTCTFSGTGSLEESTYGDGVAVSFAVETLPHTGVLWVDTPSGSGGNTSSTYDEVSEIVTAEPDPGWPSIVDGYGWTRRVYYKYIDYQNIIREAYVRVDTTTYVQRQFTGSLVYDCGNSEWITNNPGYTGRAYVQREFEYGFSGNIFNVSTQSGHLSTSVSGAPYIDIWVDCSPITGYGAGWTIVQSEWDSLTSTFPDNYDIFTHDVFRISPFRGAFIFKKPSDTRFYIWYEGHEGLIGDPITGGGLDPVPSHTIAHNPVTDEFSAKASMKTT